ncbi:Putative methyltransferase type 11, S-adenosyl-L-methionine-dependent methyltransferase superfamily [Colletotrichum destructivum]|uniref:Methyltransferase type 11, S-adenosyl-L-methionine-dependent methyltransferase superfamily n=1 Tax=Colletotrichum destructivum TaxID=34406 RepID=A0AAX4ING9_9PEZI|nr:Putative methyltransferase type 11, S-adenosyl-L-methionine-dependent methyltransferase superfamily [Colletotrichum destructivum]
MEEESEDVQYATDSRQLRSQTSNLKIEAWLSPLSDHFPTPRGFHFLSAPILPSSPSTVSADESSSPSTSSNPWNNNRSSVMTDVTEFDDLYDVTDEDEPTELRRVLSRKASVRRRNSGRNETAKQTAAGARRALPPLVIPGGRNTSTEDWSAASLKKALASPVPPTPPTRVEMSPQVFSFMQAKQAQEVPTISAPPSLDGSLSSEQLAQMSAPPTPIIGSDNGKETDWSGVRLQPGALATLHALSGDNDSLHEHDHYQQDQVLEIAPEPVPEMRQQPLRLLTNIFAQPARVAELTPSSHRRSLADLTKLDIPSPGGFFSGLSPRTRTTWHMPIRSPEDMVPPTSTTAEQFYRCPWNMDASVPPVPAAPARLTINDTAEQFYRISAPSTSAIVEQVVEVHDEGMDEDDMPTARPTVPTNTSSSSVILAEPISPETEDAPTEIVTVYDPEYARKQQEVALSNLDRTELWLMAQRAYLKPVETDQTEEEDRNFDTILETADEEADSFPEQDITLAPRKKMVRFSDIITKTDIPRRLPSKLSRQESAYYRAFQDYIIRSSKQDVFVHQLPRFEVLQAQRVCLREFHRNQLLGKYQLSVVPQSAKKRLSANVARGDDVLVDDPEKLRREKEHEAMSQMTMPTWHVAAVKMLNGGKLISAPVAQRLGRLSRMAPGRDGVARDRARVLDLGGQSTCDWAWHCALQYPNTKIYTVTTKVIRQLSNSNIRGPSNHRQVAVERLTRLPFKDDQFDLISARELHTTLKFVGENGEDEWETCLKECLRVLKPGGYLEFSVLDSDIMNAGPLGLAKSVEFGFDLKTLGYDPNPTKMFLSRLSRAGFDDVRRAWVCLPMGARSPSQQQEKPLPSLPVFRPNPTGEEVRTVAMEAMVTGSTDGVANITGVVGGWSWERWLLRCEMEKVSGELRLADTVTAGPAMREAGKSLEGVAAIVEEGRACGAGWRMLNGYARKPKTGTGLIPVGFEI